MSGWNRSRTRMASTTTGTSVRTPTSSPRPTRRSTSDPDDEGARLHADAQREGRADGVAVDLDLLGAGAADGQLPAAQVVDPLVALAGLGQHPDRDSQPAHDALGGEGDRVEPAAVAL